VIGFLRLILREEEKNILNDSTGGNVLWNKSSLRIDPNSNNSYEIK
jgi:hypothetical protein